MTDDEPNPYIVEKNDNCECGGSQFLFDRNGNSVLKCNRCGAEVYYSIRFPVENYIEEE